MLVNLLPGPAQRHWVEEGSGFVCGDVTQQGSGRRYGLLCRFFSAASALPAQKPQPRADTFGGAVVLGLSVSLQLRG